MFVKEAVHFSFLCFIRSDKGTLKYSFSISRCFSLFITCYYSLLEYAIFLRIQFSGTSWMERNTFVQFKEREKHPWKSVNFSKFAGWSFSLHHLYNLKNVKNTYGVVLILVKLQAEALACNFTKINAPPWVFFTFFKLCKLYQIAQRTTFMKRTKEINIRLKTQRWVKVCQIYFKVPWWLLIKLWAGGKWSKLLYLQGLYVVLCAIWYHLYNLKNVKISNREVLLLVPATLQKVTLLHGCFYVF